MLDHSLKIELFILIMLVQLLFETDVHLEDRLQILSVPPPCRFATGGQVRHLDFLVELQLQTQILGIVTANDKFFHGVKVYLLDILVLDDQCKI